MKYEFLFESVRRDGENKANYIFADPVDLIKIYEYDQVDEAFRKIESYSRTHYLAGYFAYELGYYFEPSSFQIPRKSVYPLIHLAVFKKSVLFSRKDELFGRGENFFSVSNTRFNYKETEYAAKIRRIKKFIRDGDTYQVNFTGKIDFKFSGSAFALYEELKKRQQVSYSAFCRMDDEVVISLSPELFFRRDGEKIYSRPMKGTIKRGKNIEEDKDNIHSLISGFKNRAENLMIVDLMRSDLGRICKTGSVNTSRLFEVEKYNTLFQMTSTVSGTLRNGIGYQDIFRNIFPGGSVTGAPKIRTMLIIEELEKSSRNIYCGALGFISPGNKAVFNMPIRTLSISGGRGQMGAGSGIVIDSDPKQEFKECLLKADFLTSEQSSFRLLETMLWDEKYTFLNAHLKRLERSAKYFDFSFSQPKILLELRRLENKFKPEVRCRVRLLMDNGGKASFECYVITGDPSRQVRYIAISKHKVDPENKFLYHKTTNRALYDNQHKYYAAKGYFDVIFLNTRDEVAEGAISNIIVQKNGRFYTPPVTCGLLPGIFRQHLLDIGKAREKTLTVGDLRKADKIFACNSVRGLVEVKLKEG
ncbi:MAG: aminodeoxychorismate synthase component I [Candidatus Omnitrophica bacterium]|nr:aminodeoxychorismate synthase component I [Candidatus Omnitrophota bacterium]